VGDSQTGALPKRIQISREAGEMILEWRDGGQSRIGLADLRKYCPCAICCEQRDQQAAEHGLHVLTGEELAVSSEITSVDSVGRYAVQIRWADGHDTGIYTYNTLRRLAGMDDGEAE
jgi:DUF971 family protein